MACGSCRFTRSASCASASELSWNCKSDFQPKIIACAEGSLSDSASYLDLRKRGPNGFSQREGECVCRFYILFKVFLHGRFFEKHKSKSRLRAVVTCEGQFKTAQKPSIGERNEFENCTSALDACPRCGSRATTKNALGSQPSRSTNYGSRPQSRHHRLVRLRQS